MVFKDFTVTYQKVAHKLRIHYSKLEILSVKCTLLGMNVSLLVACPIAARK